MTNSDQDEPSITQEYPLTSHLIELRTRLLRAISAILIVFLALFYFANDIYSIIATPLLQLSPNTGMIATEVASPFLAPIKLTLFVAIFITMPYLLTQAWGFIAPGLYQTEQRFTRALLISSILLFYCGTAFAYFIFFPLMFSFFHAVAPEGVTVMTDISNYLDFVLKTFLAFGLAFEVPVATMILIKSGITSTKQLRQGRPYIIIGAFVIGMLLTPPDIISQVLLAVPIWLFFEIGLICADYTLKDEKEPESRL